MRPVWSTLTVTSSRPFGENSASVTSELWPFSVWRSFAGRGVPELSDRSPFVVATPRPPGERTACWRCDVDRAHERAGVGVDANRVAQPDEEPPTAGREPQDGAGDMNDRSSFVRSHAPSRRPSPPRASHRRRRRAQWRGRAYGSSCRSSSLRCRHVCPGKRRDWTWSRPQRSAPEAPMTSQGDPTW